MQPEKNIKDKVTLHISHKNFQAQRNNYYTTNCTSKIPYKCPKIPPCHRIRKIEYLQRNTEHLHLKMNYFICMHKKANIIKSINRIIQIWKLTSILMKRL